MWKPKLRQQPHHENMESAVLASPSQDMVASRRVKRLLLLIGSGVTILLVMWVALLSVIIDEEAVAKQIYTKLSSFTGQDVHADSVSLSVFPTPVIVMNNLAVANDRRSTQENMLFVDRVDIALNLAEVFSGDISFLRSVTLLNPHLELERFSDTGRNWAFADKTKSLHEYFPDIGTLTIVGGSVGYNDLLNGVNGKMDEIDGTIRMEGLQQWTMNLTANSLGKPLTVKGMVSLNSEADMFQFGADVDVAITDAYGSLGYKGRFDHVGGVAMLKGDATLSTTNVFELLNALDITNQFADDAVPLPLNVTARFQTTQTIQEVSDIQFSSNDTKGKASLSIAYKNKPHAAAEVEFESFHLNQLFAEQALVGFSGKRLERLLQMLLTPDISAEIQMKTDNYVYSDQVKLGFDITASIDDHEMMVSQAQVSAPGESYVFAFGNFRKDIQNQVMFDGNVEMMGKQFLTFTNAMQFHVGSLLTTEDRPFHAKSLLSSSREQSIISNLVFATGKQSLIGGINIDHKESAQGVQGGVTLRGLDLDHILTMLHKSEKPALAAAYAETPVYYPWLHDLRTKYALNVDLRDYTVMGKTNSDAKLGLQISPDQLRLSRIAMMVGDIFVDGSLSYNQQDARPLVSSDIKLSLLNLKPFVNELRVIAPVPRGNRQSIWSKNSFDFAALQRFDSNMKFKIARIMHTAFDVDEVVADIESRSGTWKLNQFDGRIWGGQLLVRGQMDFKAISSLNLAVTLQEVRVDDVLGAVAGLSGLAGPVSIGGQISTFGLNVADWLMNSRGAFNVSGHDIVIQGFDLPGLVRTMPNVRNVETVVNQVRNSLLTNESEIDTMEGSITIEKGVMRLGDLKLRARDAIGTVTGTIDVSNWMMDVLLNLKVLTLARGDFPSVGIVFKDSMDEPMVSLDTRELEAFVARRQTGQ